MRVLHVIHALTIEAERALTDLVGQQREHGHVVRQVRVDPHAVVPTPPSPVEPIDIVHAHGFTAAASALVHLRTTPPRPPLIVTAHEWISDESGVAVRHHGETWRSVSCLTTPSALGASLATAMGTPVLDTRVIPYAVHPAPPLVDAEHELDRELTAWRTQGGDVFCAVGHDADGAFHDTVIEALSSVSRPDGLLCVLAGSVNRPACEQALAARGLTAHARFSSSPESARAIAARCDCVALSSFDQRRPFALAEAWCDGVPVLAGRNPRFADLDASGHGTVFFDAADPADLARAIATVRGTTPASRRLLVERARTQYRLQFAPAAVFAAYEAAYASVLGGQRVETP